MHKNVVTCLAPVSADPLLGLNVIKPVIITLVEEVKTKECSVKESNQWGSATARLYPATSGEGQEW